MERREAIKYVALTIGSVISVPTWASQWKAKDINSAKLYLSADKELILDEMVETIIPATNTPGAKQIGVGKFVQIMVADCYDSKAQETFKNGLSNLDQSAKKANGKTFTECSKVEKTNLLKEMEKSTDNETKSFYNLVKNLTVQGYLNSEYVMTNLLKYELVPGRFHGCVPLIKK